MSRSGLIICSVFMVLALGGWGIANAQEVLYGSGAGQTPLAGQFGPVDQATGAFTFLGVPYGGDGLTGLAIDASGRVFASTSVNNDDDTSHLIEIDPMTGTMIADIGPMLDSQGNGCGVGDLSFQPGTGVLFGLAGNNSFRGERCTVGGFGTGGYVLTIDTATAEYTIVGRDARFGNNNGGLAFAPDGTLYFLPGWVPDGTLYELDPATANVLSTTSISQVIGLMGLAVRPSDGLLFASFDRGSDDGVYTIDPFTGQVTLVGNPGGGLHDLAFTGAAVPAVPKRAMIVLALVLVALGALGLRARAVRSA